MHKRRKSKQGTPQETFRARVLRVVQKIPKGSMCTYGEVARRAGNPKAARAVGAIMRTNYDPRIPCHRVVRKDGSFGSYNRGGVSRKKSLLRGEGALLR